MNNDLEFNDNTLDHFLQIFDPIIAKYFGTIDNQKYKYKTFESYRMANKYNKVFNPIDYTKKDNFSFIENMCMVYGFDQEKANKFLWRNRLVVDKFLNQFVHVKGLSRLFNERYVEFEWDMHSRINFTEHKISFYRDHYFHQLRDCFMLYRLLENQKIYNKVSSILHESTASKISRYFSVTLERLTYNIYENKQLCDIFICSKFEKMWNNELYDQATNYLEKLGFNVSYNEKQICNLLKTNIIEQLGFFSKKGSISKDTELVTIIAKYLSLPKYYVDISNSISEEAYSDNMEIVNVLTQKLENANLTCSDIRAYFVDNDNLPDISSKQKINTVVKEYIKYRIADGLVNRIYSILNEKIDSFNDIANEVDDYFTRYIVFSTAIIASLLHDIGYPVVHFFGLQKRLQNFSSPIYMLINGDKSSYEKISSTLSQSLLFQIVGKEEIVDRCEKGDHGAFSSIILLLHYYESGLIFSLPLEQRTAIELASVAIYNHTNNYKVLKKKGKSKKSYYFKPIFKLNPISFLLRICDDAQEWERTYFEIGDTQSLLYCNKCKTPLIRIREEETKGFKYCCRCKLSSKGNSKQNQANQPSENNNLQKAYYKNVSTDFSRRIIYDVTPSDSLRLNFKDNSMTFRFSYNYFWLLRMCSINTTYAKQRTEELNIIKQLVLGQNIGYNIDVSFRMSYNPILIKSWIIGAYCKQNDVKLIGDIIQGFVPDIKVSLKKQFIRQLNFYKEIYDIGNTLNEDECLDDKVNAIITKYKLGSNISLLEYSKKVISNMILDALLQYNREKFCTKEDYRMKYMVSGDFLLFDVNYYCDSENTINSNQTSNFYPDYYSDLYLFECMNNSLK